MIIVKLFGGLGNQMFQYAFGRALSLRFRVPLKLDLSWFENVNEVVAKRNFELHAYALQCEFAGRREVAQYDRQPGRICWRNRLGKILGLSSGQRYMEKDSLVDPNIEKLDYRRNVYLEGYWQNPKYFEGERKLLMQDLEVKTPMDQANENTARSIMNSNSVSVHIRRGDYVAIPHVARFHGVCPPDYYERAFQAVGSKVRDPNFFIFSDDSDWARANLKIPPHATWVSHNPTSQGWEDLRLMKLCQHHIIANSTFSWWGAWLCENPGKIVIAPQEWFRDPEANAQTRDLIPPNWIRL